jgi:murein DD-endopeptidase MepM/ murein hydrolase activator NlpD
MDSFFSRHLPIGFVLTGCILVAGCNSDPVVWPVSGTTAGDWTLLTSTFGPRIRSDGETYDFNRGIDIAVPERTNVHSVAAGTVQLIEQITDVGGMRVQIAHDGYVSNYMHLLAVDAQVGDLVDPGDTIATSGVSNDGTALLHFEIRQPGTEQRDCVHPFRVLPYFDRGAPSLFVDAIDTTVPTSPKIMIRVVMRNRELDLVRVSAAIYEAPASAIVDGLTPMSVQEWDMEKWNREKSDATNSNSTLINDPVPNGIEVHPTAFDNVSTEQTIGFTFTQLIGPADASRLHLRVEAEDVSGNVAVVTQP